jgi:hypothetical protein
MALNQRAFWIHGWLVALAAIALIQLRVHPLIGSVACLTPGLVLVAAWVSGGRLIPLSAEWHVFVGMVCTSLFWSSIIALGFLRDWPEPWTGPIYFTLCLLLAGMAIGAFHGAFRAPKI